MFLSDSKCNLGFGVWALHYSIISEIILEKKIRKKFDPVYLDKEYREKEGDEARTLMVRIPEREEELEWNQEKKSILLK